jgi:hypothetical protein
MAEDTCVTARYSVAQRRQVQQVDRYQRDVLRHHHRSLRISQQHLLVGVVGQQQRHEAGQRAHREDRLEENHRDVQQTEMAVGFGWIEARLLEEFLGLALRRGHASAVLPELSAQPPLLAQFEQPVEVDVDDRGSDQGLEK